MPAQEPPQTAPQGPAAGAPETEHRGARLEALVLIPNLVLVGLVVLYLVSLQGGPRVSALVQGDSQITGRIQRLELEIERDPRNLRKALELARLYRDVGEFPWCYSALRAAEREGRQEPRWRMALGLAFLELGKNEDALRVLRQASTRCSRGGAPRCSENTKLKLQLFVELAEKLEKRRIDARKHAGAAEKALHELLKPVAAEPDKMRPKAPAGPAEEQKPAGQSDVDEPAG